VLDPKAPEFRVFSLRVQVLIEFGDVNTLFLVDYSRAELRLVNLHEVLVEPN
jgi:hypothetical protein